MKKFLLVLVAALFIVFVAGCKDTEEPVVYTLELTGPQSVKAGETITLTATTNMENPNFVWSSSNTGVATVANGTVTGVSDGTAVITVSLADVGEKFIVVNVSEFSFSLAGADTVKVGYTETMTVTTDKPSPVVTWTTSDATVATVANGVVTGVKVGTATITATLAGVGYLEKTIEVLAQTSLTVGSTTEAGVNMFSTFWGNNATNADVRELTFGYSTVSYQKEAARYVLDPSVVENFETTENEDGSKTYTIEIKQDLLWSDGTSIDAKDYVFSLLLSINPVMGQVVGKTLTTTGDILGSKDYANTTSNANGLAELAGVDLIGDYEFSVTIDASRFPYYYEFLYYSVTPWPMHVVAPGADIQQGTNGAKFTNLTKAALQTAVDEGGEGYRYDISVTSGPYKLYDFDTQTSTATLVKNPYYKGNYEGQKPSIDTIVFKYVTTATQLQSLLNGEIDLIESVSGGDAIIAGLQEVAYGKINFSTFSRNGYGLLSFHSDPAAGPTSSVNVRQAVAYLLNRTAFAETYTRGYGILPHGQYGLAQWMVAAASDENGNVQGRDAEGDLVELQTYTYNPAKAVELLVADGWTLDANGDPYVQTQGAVRYKRVGTELVKLEIPWANTTGNPVSDLLRAQLLPNAAAVGLAIKDQAMDFNTLLYQHYYGAYGDGYLVPEKDENGNWVIPEYEAKDEFGEVIEPDLREYHMVNLGTGFTTGLFEPYYDVSIEYWGWDGGANINYIYDEEMLDAAERMMRASTDEEYLFAWQQYQARYNLLLPAIPLYSDVYHAFYSPSLVNYDVTAEWDLVQAVLYADIQE
jgi:peptide/nickel transport system substrate-binding protein